MELTTLSDWAFVYLYYFSQIIFIFSSAFWFLKERKLSVMAFSFGFFLFLYGNYNVVKISKWKTELEQRNESVDSLDVDWRRSRAISSSGFFLASISLTLYVVGVKRKQGNNTGHA
ncbi:MAG: hypothetical protein ACK4SX_13240 [Alcanivoracaceae bacterium]